MGLNVPYNLIENIESHNLVEYVIFSNVVFL